MKKIFKILAYILLSIIGLILLILLSVKVFENKIKLIEVLWEIILDEGKSVYCQ